MSGAFITGSRAYGNPRPDSDIDLVVRMDEATLAILRLLNESGNDNVIRFGNLNIIPALSDADYAVWVVGTKQLIRRKECFGESISRDDAKGLLDNLRSDLGLSHFENSPSDPKTVPSLLPKDHLPVWLG